MNRCIYGTSKRNKNCTIWRKKYFRIIEYVRQRLFAWFVGIICSLGCGYQVYTALRAYLAYPSLVSPALIKEAAEFPGVTVCPENWYNMTRLCQYWPQNCTRKDMQLHSVPKFTIMNEFRFYGQPTIENLFKCRMMSRSEVCPAFDCVELFVRRTNY
ncbi:uncharacterized protein LOC111260003 [Varroa jacobsoni]|uniref:uncharacterized protein LOC111260003 n=1 Tax=Varroa jacobsoni TaxID=62625 RepID=UPI000BF81842|nr:uncharacterized protein LOC111260003 [Varroa jacobsoni]